MLNLETWEQFDQ